MRIRLLFDGRSTEVIEVIGCNTSVPADTLASVTLTNLFIQAAVTTIVMNVVQRSNYSRMGVERQLNCHRFEVESLL